MSEASVRMQELQALAQAKNPANLEAPTRAERRRIPMTGKQPKLTVPEIPGHVTFWFLGEPDRLAQARAAWYEFVDAAELEDGNPLKENLEPIGTDLSSRVSVVAGSEIDQKGQPVRLYLMKIRREYYEEDLAETNGRNADVATELTAQFRKGTIGGPDSGETGEDVRQRYVDAGRSQIPEFFKPKRRS